MIMQPTPKNITLFTYNSILSKFVMVEYRNKSLSLNQNLDLEIIWTLPFDFSKLNFDLKKTGAFMNVSD